MGVAIVKGLGHGRGFWLEYRRNLQTWLMWGHGVGTALLLAFGALSLAFPSSAPWVRALGVFLAYVGPATLSHTYRLGGLSAAMAHGHDTWPCPALPVHSRIRGVAMGAAASTAAALYLTIIATGFAYLFGVQSSPNSDAFAAYAAVLLVTGVMAMAASAHHAAAVGPQRFAVLFAPGVVASSSVGLGLAPDASLGLGGALVMASWLIAPARRSGRAVSMVNDRIWRPRPGLAPHRRFARDLWRGLFRCTLLELSLYIAFVAIGQTMLASSDPDNGRYAEAMMILIAIALGLGGVANLPSPTNERGVASLSGLREAASLLPISSRRLAQASLVHELVRFHLFLVLVWLTAPEVFRADLQTHVDLAYFWVTASCCFLAAAGISVLIRFQPSSSRWPSVVCGLASGSIMILGEFYPIPGPEGRPEVASTMFLVALAIIGLSCAYVTIRGPRSNRRLA